MGGGKWLLGLLRREACSFVCGRERGEGGAALFGGAVWGKSRLREIEEEDKQKSQMVGGVRRLCFCGGGKKNKFVWGGSGYS